MQEITNNKEEKKIAQIAQIENFIKEKNVSAVEACRQLGVKSHLYYSFRANRNKNKGGRPPKKVTVSTFTTLAPLAALVDTSHMSLALAKLGWHTGVLAGLIDRILSDKNLTTYFETRGVTRDTFETVRNTLTSIAKSY